MGVIKELQRKSVKPEFTKFKAGEIYLAEFNDEDCLFICGLRDVMKINQDCITGFCLIGSYESNCKNIRNVTSKVRIIVED